MYAILKKSLNIFFFLTLAMVNVSHSSVGNQWSIGYNSALGSDFCQRHECIGVTTEPPGTYYGARPSAGMVNWGDLTSHLNIDGLSAARERAGTGQTAYETRKGFCNYMADKAHLKCKKTVTATGASVGTTCIYLGLIFTAATGAVCSSVVAGATAYSILQCDEDLIEDKEYCKRTIG